MISIEQAIQSIVAAEEKARESYMVEGYRTDGTCLYKCRFCKQEAWGRLAMISTVRHTPQCRLGIGAVDGELEYMSWNGAGR